MAKEVLNGAKLKKVLAALAGNWQAEMEGHRTYLALADRDPDVVRAQVLRHLAGAEWEHAALWAGRIRELGGPEPVYTGRPHGEAIRWPTGPAASAWPCAAWRSKKAATSPTMASN